LGSFYFTEPQVIFSMETIQIEMKITHFQMT